jgi:hypothetical protein
VVVLQAELKVVVVEVLAVEAVAEIMAAPVLALTAEQGLQIREAVAVEAIILAAQEALVLLLFLLHLADLAILTVAQT